MILIPSILDVAIGLGISAIVSPIVIAITFFLISRTRR